MNALLATLDKMLEQPLGARDEYQLTDALMHMINSGIRFRTLSIKDWYDCGKKQGLLRANRILLERIKEFPPFDCENSIIIPPVHIPTNCRISHSIIGPNVAIADHSVISNSIVKNSILGAYSRLESIIIKDSIIGNDTSLKGKSSSINIGDNTEIDFG